VVTNKWIKSTAPVRTNILLQYVVWRIQLYINCDVQYVSIYILFSPAKLHQLILWCWSQDNHAVQSFERGINAQKSAAFAWEIVQVEVSRGRGKPSTVVDKDEALGKYDACKCPPVRGITNYQTTFKDFFYSTLVFSSLLFNKSSNVPLSICTFLIIFEQH